MKRLSSSMLRILTSFTLDFINLHAKKSKGAKSGDRGAHILGESRVRFLCMGIYKIKVCQVKIRNIEELKQCITAAIGEITPAMLRHVFWVMVERWELYRDVQGGHIEMY
ncbi:hypothetical protein AVEN_17710-1 [Araneus ventricosus]|uniref:Uncharacterized protein n=1 Tax=Araneus ventricosus TaxID=182803 RepID=A0A4Y2I3G6_ARAVE|nr:hypothetical protein AVEN_250710-1 [Araneus ventricosus]GBM72210.1 hypothetical protein AVEN_17710-1 [Araneus ventricosus]